MWGGGEPAGLALGKALLGLKMLNEKLKSDNRYLNIDRRALKAGMLAHLLSSMARSRWFCAICSKSGSGSTCGAG